MHKLKKNNLLNIGFVLVAATVVILILPKGSSFKYDFQKGKPWLFENLYAPFDFQIYKLDNDIEEEKEEIRRNIKPYYYYDYKIAEKTKRLYETEFETYFTNNISYKKKKFLYNLGKELLNKILERGVMVTQKLNQDLEINLIREKNIVEVIPIKKIFNLNDLPDFLNKQLTLKKLKKYHGEFYDLFFNILNQNVYINEELTQKIIEEEVNKISLTRGQVDKGILIIAKGEVVEGKSYNLLMSLKKEYQSEVWNDSNYISIVLAYSILICFLFFLLLLFIKKYHQEVYQNFNQFSLIYFNVVLFISITIVVLKIDFMYIYMIPMCIIPICLRSFFSVRLTLFVYIITLFTLGIVVPSTFKYLFIQVSTGIVSILAMSKFYRRSNLFITVGYVVLVSILEHLIFNVLQEGSIINSDLSHITYFVINGLIILFSLPLTYIYEKAYGLTSDVSLLELTDTNSRLLKELSEKAPGTFNHSLQVANLAEAAANEIGANALLVRVGALYHDIGKLKNPIYFSENQIFIKNPHEKLSPKESARIIINHINDGIEIAKKNNLPQRIIDFIRTHHGNSMVYYFFSKQKDMGETFDHSEFMYSGPTPFSKEMAILMMADSIEAGSKSLEQPTTEICYNFVDKIINKQMHDNQFINSDITFKEIEKIKTIFKNKLVNIYNLRVAYPE